MYDSEEFSGAFVGAPALGGQWDHSMLPEYQSSDYMFPWSQQDAFYPQHHSSPVVAQQPRLQPPPPPPPPTPPAPAASTLPHASLITHNFTSTSAAPNGFRANGKPKRVRTAFTSSQLLELEAVFRRTTYVTKTDRTELSARLGLKDRAIKVWFQNRRMKHKKEGSGDKFSMDECSPPPPEVCSSTTDIPERTTTFLQYHHQPSHTNYDSSFASLHAQEIFNRAVLEYNNSNKQHNNPIMSNNSYEQSTFVERSQYDNISPPPQYINNDYFPHSTEYSTQISSIPDSIAPSIDATTVLNGIENDMATYRDDSGLVSMNGDSLDKLGALVSQCITTNVDDVMGESQNDYTYPQAHEQFFNCEAECKSTTDTSIFDFLLVKPTVINVYKQEETNQTLNEPMIIERDVNLEFSNDNTDIVTQLSPIEETSVDIKVEDIPLPGE